MVSFRENEANSSSIIRPSKALPSKAFTKVNRFSTRKVGAPKARAPRTCAPSNDRRFVRLAADLTGPASALAYNAARRAPRRAELPNSAATCHSVEESSRWRKTATRSKSSVANWIRSARPKTRACAARIVRLPRPRHRSHPPFRLTTIPSSSLQQPRDRTTLRHHHES